MLCNKLTQIHALDQAEADGKKLLPAAGVVKFFFEIHREAVLAELIKILIEIRGIGKTRAVPIAEGGRAEPEKGAPCPIACIVLRMHARLCESGDLITLQANRF